MLLGRLYEELLLLLRELLWRVYPLRELLLVAVRCSTEEEPVLRRGDSSFPMRLLPDERTVPDGRELLPAPTRTEELRLEPLLTRCVEPLPERLVVAPVRDDPDVSVRRDETLPVCVSRRVAVPVVVRWFGNAFGPLPPHSGLPTPKPG